MRTIKSPRLITDNDLEDCVIKNKQPIFGCALMNFSNRHINDEYKRGLGLIASRIIHFSHDHFGDLMASHLNGEIHFLEKMREFTYGGAKALNRMLIQESDK